MTDGSHLSREARRAGGVYYTPAPIVQYIVRETLNPLLSAAGQLEAPIRVLDPACGDGVFLEEAYRHLLRWRLDRFLRADPAKEGAGRGRAASSTRKGRPPLAARECDRILRTQLFGVDVDQEAVDATRRRLATAVGSAPDGGAASNKSSPRKAAALAAHIRRGDALIDSDFRQFASARDDEPPAASLHPMSWTAAFPDVLNSPEGGFDAIVGNPPYINARRLAKTHGSVVKDYFRANYRCARRGYDTYVLFLEKAFQLLRPGGVCGMIAPNKLATLDYALPCRAMLIRETTIRQIVDVSGLGLFAGAGVYPYIFIWRKEPPRRAAQVAVLHARSLDDLARPRFTLRVRQTDMSPEAGLAVHGVLDVESRVPTRPLADRAVLHSGATGFTARRLADSLLDGPSKRPAAGCFEFIVSGNIDRYRVRLGDVRFMRRVYSRPLLPKDAAVLTEGKRELYERRKIVIAGMTRRLEAAWDGAGLALGVQVFAATRLKDNPLYVLALLNSKLLSHLFRIRFQAKRLAGGFLAVNKGQLEKLPVRTVAPGDRAGRAVRDRIIQWAERMHDAASQRRPTDDAPSNAKREWSAEAMDRRIDRLVYQLYELTEQEIDRVEADMNSAPR